MPQAPQSSPFADIVRSVRRRLAARLGIDPAFVRVVSSDSFEAPDLFEMTFLVIRYYGPEPDSYSGAGRKGTLVSRRLRVYLYTRNSTGVPGDDADALTDPDIGHGLVEDQVYDALVDWPPLDAAADRRLAVERVHPLPPGGPPARREEADVGLIRSHLDFGIKYAMPLDTTLPPG